MSLENYVNLQRGQVWSLQNGEIEVKNEEEAEDTDLDPIFQKMAEDVTHAAINSAESAEALMKLKDRVKNQPDQSISKTKWLSNLFFGGHAKNKKLVLDNIYSKIHTLFFETELDGTFTNEYREQLDHLFLLLTNKSLLSNELQEGEAWIIENFPELELDENRLAFFTQMHKKGMAAAQNFASRIQNNQDTPEIFIPPQVPQERISLKAAEALLLQGDFKRAAKIYENESERKDISNQEAVAFDSLSFLAARLDKATEDFSQSNLMTLEMAVNGVAADEYPKEELALVAQQGNLPLLYLQAKLNLEHTKSELTENECIVAFSEQLWKDPEKFTNVKLDELGFDFNLAFSAELQPAIRAKLAESNPMMMFLEAKELLKMGKNKAATELLSKASEKNLKPAADLLSSIPQEDTFVLAEIPLTEASPETQMEVYFSHHPLSISLQNALKPEDLAMLYQVLMAVGEEGQAEVITNLNVALDEGYLPIALETLPDYVKQAEKLKIIKDAEDYFVRNLSHDYLLEKCPDDGDCFYHAVGRGLDKEMMDVRKDLSQFMILNQEQLIDSSDIAVIQLLMDGDFKDLVALTSQKAASSQGWGSLGHAKLLSWLYKVPVTIHSHFYDLPVVFNQDMKGNLFENKKPVELLYNGINHWDRIVKKGPS